MTPNSDLRKILKYITYMKITEKISNLSYDSKHQVGSIIVNSDFSNISAVGYNGNYPQGKNQRDSMETGMSGYLHAEENAIIEANLMHGEDYILFVTMTPCKMCAKRISRKRKYGLKEVVALDVYGTSPESQQILSNANIEFLYLHEKVARLFRDTHLAHDLNMNLKYRNLDGSVHTSLETMLERHIGYFFEANETPLANLPKVTFETIEGELSSDTTKRYTKALYDYLYPLL
jgi:dCMP deaminase